MRDASTQPYIENHATFETVVTAVCAIRKQESADAVDDARRVQNDEHDE